MRYVVQRLLLCTAILLSLTTLPGRADDGISLQWKWEKGRVLRYRMIQEHRQMAPGTIAETVTRQTVVLREEVTDVTEDGVATVQTSFEAVRMEMDTPSGKMSYDSANPSDLVKASTFMFRPNARLANASFTMKLNREGKVLELSGFEKTMSGLLPPEQEGGAIAAGMNAQIKHMYSDQSMKQMMDTSLNILPDRPVAAGGTWNRQISAEMPVIGTMTEQGTYTLERVDEKEGQKVAHITSKAQLSMNAPAPYAGMLKSSMKSGATSGEIDFDIEQGCLLRQVQNIRMEIETTLLGPSPVSAPGRQTTTRRLNQTITLEWLP